MLVRVLNDLLCLLPICVLVCLILVTCVVVFICWRYCMLRLVLVGLFAGCCWLWVLLISDVAGAGVLFSALGGCCWLVVACCVGLLSV